METFTVDQSYSELVAAREAEQAAKARLADAVVHARGARLSWREIAQILDLGDESSARKRFHEVVQAAGVAA